MINLSKNLISVQKPTSYIRVNTFPGVISRFLVNLSLALEIYYLSACVCSNYTASAHLWDNTFKYATGEKQTVLIG